MNRFFLLSLFFAGILFSYSTEDAEVIDQPITFKNIGDLDGLDRGDCFDFIYPLTYIMPDGSVITIENEEGLSELRTWYQANPRYTERPSFQYPLEIISFEGAQTSIDNNEELRVAYSACEEERCFDLVYPVTYIMPDGSLIPVADENSSGEFSRWYKENPDVEDGPTLQYPIEVVFYDGSYETISTHAQMQEVLENCD